MTAPGFETPVPPPDLVPSQRRRWVWWLLVAIFGFYILGAIWPYLVPPKDQGAVSATRVAQLRMAYVTQTLPGTAGYGDAERRQVLKEIQADTASTRRTNRNASFLHALASTELGQRVDPQDLAPLRESGRDMDAALAELYSSQKLTHAQAESLRNRISGDAFPRRLARVQAMEKSGDSAAREALFSGRDRIALFLALGGIVSALGLGLIAWVVYGLQRAQGGWRPLGHPMSRVDAASADVLAMRMILFLLVFTAVPLTLAPLGSGLPDLLVMSCAMVVILLVTVAILAVPLMGSPGGLRQYVGRTDQWPSLVLWGVGGFLANVPIVLVLATVGSALTRGLPEASHPLTDQIAGGMSPVMLVAAFVLASVLAPLLEELTFRGLLQPAIAKFAGVAGGAILSGVLFAAIHPQGPALILALAAVGSVAAALAHQTGSLVPAIVMHSVHNTAILALGLALN